MKFSDRREAADRLIETLRRAGTDFDVVVALPRGGVVLGVAVAQAFQKPLELIIPRKIGARDNEEYAIGAVLEDGTAVWAGEEKDAADPAWLEGEIARERAEAKRRRETYLGSRPRVDLRGKSALIVDDGVATGLTMRLALLAAREAEAKRIIVAVPVAPADSVEALRREADEVVVLETPVAFGSIGAFYSRFDQVTDEEVVEMMSRV